MPNNSHIAITFGSNFGFDVHHDCLLNFFNFDQIAICSPNINKKKINISKKFMNYKLALKNDYDFVSISTPPRIQNKICNLILRKKVKPKYLIIEKPIAENFKESTKLFEELKKNKLKFFVNFIFINIEEFLEFKKLINNKEIITFNYVWNFKQGFFLNKKKTWKISDKDGGGLVNFYLIHVFYNLLFFFKKIKILNVNFAKHEKLITKCNILLNINDSFNLKISMNINSDRNLHYLNFTTKNSFFELSNTSKDWVNGFNLKKNKKKLVTNSKKINRNSLTLSNYLNIKVSKNRIKNNLLSEKAHKLCNQALNFISK